MTIGERIKQKRLELGLSQTQLAERMGYKGKSSVCRAETYGNNVTTVKVKKFADALGCTFSELMGWHDAIPIELDMRKQQHLTEVYGKLNERDKELLLTMADNLLSTYDK